MLPFLAGGSSGLGFLVGKFLVAFGAGHFATIGICIGVAVVAIVVGAYVIAPIRAG